MNAASILAQLPEHVRDITDRMDEAQAVKLAQTAYAREYAEAILRAREHAEGSRRGGVKTVQKTRMGLLGADPAGARWKADFRSPLNKAVFPAWGKVPVYVPPLVRFMSATVAKTVIVIGDIVDHLGDFELPRAQHAERIETSERVAYAALETLRNAGLLVVKHPGNRTQATVWSYAPVQGVDTVKARQVLQATRARATERIVAATQL